MQKRLELAHRGSYCGSSFAQLERAPRRFKRGNMRYVRVLLPFAILCMSLAPSQADRARSTKFACWRPPGRCWLWRWQAAAYHLPSPAQPPPRPSHLPRRSTASSAAAVARRARSRRPWARHARYTPHPTLAGPLPPPQCATRCPAGRSASWARLTVVPGSGHRIPALGTVRAAAVSSNG